MAGSQPTVGDIKSLFQNDPSIDQAAAGLMINSLNGANLTGCVGAPIDEIETDDVTLVKVLLDGSLSMNSHEATVRECYDKFIESLKGSKQGGSILVSTVVFSTRATILHGFKKSMDIGPIGKQYTARGGSTALYDPLMEAITGAQAYAKDLKLSGVRSKIIIAVFSDGDDNDSNKNTANDCKVVVEASLKKEGFYPVYIGYKQDPSDDLDAIADAVGFVNKLTTTASPSEIRRTMDLVSKSVVRTSQTTIGGANNSFF